MSVGLQQEAVPQSVFQLDPDASWHARVSAEPPVGQKSNLGPLPVEPLQYLFVGEQFFDVVESHEEQEHGSPERSFLVELTLSKHRCHEVDLVLSMLHPPV